MRSPLPFIFFVITLFAILLAGGWTWVLSSQEPLDNPIAGFFPWPVACSMRGCVTTFSWKDQFNLDIRFSAITGESRPSSSKSLTTIIRRHLVDNAVVKSPATLADAKRYR